MNMILTDLTPSVLIPAMEVNLQEALIRWGHGLGATFYDKPEGLWFVSGTLLHFCNSIVRTTITSNNIDAAIVEILKPFMAQKLPLAWLICPSTRPTDLGARLEAHGLYLDDTVPGMAVDLQTLAGTFLPSGLTIKEVFDGESMQVWIHVMTVGSDLPDSVREVLFNIYKRHGFVRSSSPRYYIGLLNGEPVATSLLFLGGGIAGIYNVATLPHVRGQGIGTALTLAPLYDARALGYRVGTLQSTQMGLHVYQRLGFQEYCKFSFYFRERG